jgi:peptide/nickel transport system permease protein
MATTLCTEWHEDILSMVAQTPPSESSGLAGRQEVSSLAPRASLATRASRLARRNPVGTVALLILVIVWLVAAFAPQIAHYYWKDSLNGPRLAHPSGKFWFGTDYAGRDVFSQVVWGARLSLTVSFVATVLGIGIGSLIGVLSGYFLGLFDLLLQRVLDAFQALPVLVLLMVIVTIFGPQLSVVALALLVITVPGSSRIVRSTVISIRENAYIESAEAIGAGHTRIILRYIIPNSFAPVIVLAALQLGGNLLIQAALSFLGLTSSQYPDWGGLLNAGARQYMVTAPWLVFAPGIAIALTVLAYNMLGDSLRDILDPRLRGGS